jgi:xanthine/uracil/vitamin C permease (AzgA family)
MTTVGTSTFGRGETPKGAIRFSRNEWSGAFGDLGTDLPLLVGMIVAAHLDAASVLTIFGVMQILTALRYRIPMPVQPLKAMAALVIAQKLPGNVLFGAGLAIGMVMLLLTVTGLVDWVARVIPKAVVRGIQLGLGLQLASIALKDYAGRDGVKGWLLAAVGFATTIVLIGRRKVPSAIILIGLGCVYAFAFHLAPLDLVSAAGWRLPIWHIPSSADIWTGFVVLALPQIPLSLANSILATRQIAEDFFPERRITVRRISFTYAAMNLLSPFGSGVPTCHGSGGMAGHYAFGGRTGGSVIIYGALYLVFGLFFGRGFDRVVQVFPMPILGVLLLFEALTLIVLVKDLSDAPSEFFIAVLVGLVAANVPYGYLVGLIAGTLILLAVRRGLFNAPIAPSVRRL